MSKFTDAVRDALNMVDWDYDHTNDTYKISHQQLLNLCENMILTSIYNPDVRDEVFLDKAQ